MDNTFKYVKTKSSIVISYSGRMFNISTADPRYSSIVESLKENKMNTVHEILEKNEREKIKEILMIGDWKEKKNP